MEVKVIDCTVPYKSVKGLFWYRYIKPGYIAGTSEEHYELFENTGNRTIDTGVSLYTDPRESEDKVYCEIVPPYRAWNRSVRHRRTRIAKDKVMKTIEDLTTEYLLFNIDKTGNAYCRANGIAVGAYAFDESEGLNGDRVIQVFGPRKASNPYWKTGKWGAVMSWNPKTKKAKGFVSLEPSYSWKSKVLRVDKPEDIGNWALTVLRMQGMV